MIYLSIKCFYEKMIWKNQCFAVKLYIFAVEIKGQTLNQIYFYEKVYIIIHNVGVVYGLFHGTGGCCESLHLQF